MRQKVTSGTEWESLVGYSRAVRVGPLVYVSGTTAVDAAGRVVGDGDAGLQTRQCLLNIEAALRESRASLADVVRTRIYVVDIGAWRQIGDVHAELFRDVRPATTIVEVKGLIRPELLVEIEADAVLEGEFSAAPGGTHSGPPEDRNA